jgi:hypothetical protein
MLENRVGKSVVSFQADWLSSMDHINCNFSVSKLSTGKKRDETLSRRRLPITLTINEGSLSGVPYARGLWLVAVFSFRCRRRACASRQAPLIPQTPQ